MYKIHYSDLLRLKCKDALYSCATIRFHCLLVSDHVLGVSPTKSDGHVSQDDSAAEEEAAVTMSETEPEMEPEPAPVAEPEPIVDPPVQAEVTEPEPVPVAQPAAVDEVLADEPANSDLDCSQAAAAYHLNETQPIDQLTTTVTMSSATEESVSASATNASTEDTEMVERSVPPPVVDENDNAADVPEESAAAEAAQPMEVTEAAKSDEADNTNADEASQETAPADDLKPPAAPEDTASQHSKTDEKREDSRKRKRSRSPSPKRRQRTNSTAANTDDFTSVEDEPEVDPDKVTLSWIDSDLQLRINASDLCDARPISDAALGLVWAGARATHGVRVGQKVFYEVQLGQKNNRVNFEQEKNLFDLRCGWSVVDSGLHLGDAPLSFGYDGEGKKYRGGSGEDYGKAFEVDDVVGVYLVSG